MLGEIFKALMMVLALAGGVSAASATYQPPRHRPPVDEGCRELPAPAPAAPPTVVSCQ